ncbi:MAG TPA: HYR domain-containing protein, partial [Woeseiaceae bacterium]|nr:HYR domain-containing protein [Woeseiaceae bacterium]
GSEQEFLVETLTVDGALAGGDLVNINPFLPDVNLAEIHDPSVFAPTAYDPALDNPQIWNPQIWNPQIWNPQIWNPQIWNPQIWNPQIWNPQIWNPQIWNPQIWNAPVTDADELDNEEIPQPELSGLVDADGNPPEPNEPLAVAKVDVQFGVSNDGNTTTPYTADFAVNSPLVRQRLAEGKVKVQLIVWEDARLDSFQACNPDPTAGQLRVIAAVNNPDLLNLQVPDIFNNRFGSVTYYLEPDDKLQITLRFIGFPDVIREIAPELTGDGLSYVVTSQAANTGEDSLNQNDSEQVLSDKVPPTISVNQATPVALTAIARPDAQGNPQVGAVLPGDLVTASKGEFEPSLAVSCISSTAGSVELGEFAAVGLGQSTLTCSATAANGVRAEVEFGLDIRDVNPPQLSGVPASFLLERELVNGTDLSATLQAAATAFNGAEDLPVATDDIDGTVAVQCAYPSAAGEVPLAPGGIAPFDAASNPTATAVTCSATDSSGNSTSGSFTITVRDVTPPALAPIADVSVAAVAANGTSVSVAAPSATDAGNIVASDCSAFGGATSVVGLTLFPIGATPVTCTATDDVGNTGTTSFTVVVVDTTPPSFDTTVDDFTVEANAIGGANVTFTAPTASDLGQAVAVQCSANPAGSFFPIGSTTVTCTATDLQGNTATDTFVVTIADTTPPVLTVPGDITVLFGETVTFDATATDNADADLIVSCDPPSGTVFPVGTTTVNCTATDDAGLTGTGSFVVNVVLGGTSSLSSNKNSVNAGAVASFNWVWTDYLGNPVDVGLGNQDVEARPGNCPSTADDVLNEDPGSSDIRLQGDGNWTFNWQTVDDAGNPVAAGVYCFSVVLMTTDPQQSQSTEIRVR